MKIAPLLYCSTPLTSNYDYYDSATETYYFQDERVLTTYQYEPLNHFTNQPYVANGYFGSKIPNLGFGFSYDQNENSSSSQLDAGWPLFNKRYAGAYIAGFYDAQENTTGTNFPELLKNGYESVISSIPQWTELKLTLTLKDGSQYVLDPENLTSRGLVSDYKQSLNMSSGTVTTSYNWMDLVQLNITVIAHREIALLGLIRLDIKLLGEPDDISSFLVEDILDFNSTNRCWLQDLGVEQETASIYMSVNPENVPYISASVFSTLKTEPETAHHSFLDHTKVSSSIDVRLSAMNRSFTVLKYVGIVSSDLEPFSDNLNSGDFQPESNSARVFEAAKSIALSASRIAWQTLVHSNENAWEKLWGESEIVVQNDGYMTLAAQASLYHLFANTRSTNTDLTSALGVTGLSADGYGGMVFWDSDLWMLPGILPFAPQTAASIERYRYYLHKQAVQNARTGNMTGSVYPWTSGRFGNCTATGPCFDYEYHINIAVCYAIHELYLSGAINDQNLLEEGWPVLRDTANFFSDYVQYNETLGKFTTFNLTDPDEYANHVNNAAYTAVGIAQVMKWALLIGAHLHQKTTPIWATIRDQMYLPVTNDGEITLEYDDMNSTVLIKQADVALITYIDDQDGFLAREYNYTKQRAYNDLVYYTQRQSSEGPAMTYPVYLAASEKLSDVGCGYQTYLEQSVKPFLRFPFAQLSEQSNDDFDSNGGTHPAFPFLTGHGGVVQSFVYGLLGIRFSYQVNADDSLLRVLHVDPVYLPRFSGNYTLRGFNYLGEVLDIEVDNDCKAIPLDNGCSASFTSHGRKKEPVYIYVDGRNSATGLHMLPPNSTLSVPLFVPQMNLDGALTECSADVISITEGTIGDIVDSITDGDNSTYWQAVSKRKPARVVVDLKSSKGFDHGAIIWGPRLASSFSVSVVQNCSSLQGHDFNELQEMLDQDGKSSRLDILTVFKDQSVRITSPYDSNNHEIRIRAYNYTTFDLGKTYTARYVVLDLEGVIDMDSDDGGAEVAEFALF